MLYRIIIICGRNTKLKTLIVLSTFNAIVPSSSNIMELFTNVVLGLGTLLIFVYMYFQKCYKYWENKKIPSTDPVFPFGDMNNPLTDKIGFNFLIKNLYNNFKSKGFKYGGFYFGKSPVFTVLSPEYLKLVLTKDYQYFASHGRVVDTESDPLSVHLFNIEGKEWKYMRAKLTPTFTSGKMRMMFQLLLTCGEQMKEHIDKLHNQKSPLDIKEILACFTTDVIGSCAFGLDCNSFKNPDAEFRKYGRLVFAESMRGTLRRLLTIAAPILVKPLKLTGFDSNVTRFFIGVIETITKERENNLTTRNDFMQLLLELRKNAKATGEDEFTIKQMAGQAFLFFIAGFETSSTTMTWCLYELAHNHEIQDKLRREITSTIEKHGALNYDAIQDMKYLTQVINETMRKHPPVSTLPRSCTQDYKLPGNEIIEKGTSVLISVLGIHHDPEYYPDPEKFDPERFSDKNKDNIVPYTFLPFGEGPRSCIGLRFARMQVKLGLCLLLSNYKMHPHESLKYPVDYDPKLNILSAKGTVLLEIEKVA